MEPFVSRIAAAVAAATDLSEDDVKALVAPSNNPARGDLSLACFPLAAKRGEKGKDAANALATRLADLSIEEVAVEAAGPFLNFKIDPAAAARIVLHEVWSKPRYGSSDEGRGQTVVIDFSSPNIAKPFHLGHLRSTVIGWSLRQIYRALGYTVVGVNHLGDWGTQFGLMIAAWKRWNAEAEERLAAIERGEAQERDIELFVELYQRINKLADEDPSAADEGRLWFKKLEDGDPEARRLWTFFVERSKVEFARIYELLGIVHESEAGEAFYEDKMPTMVQRLRDSGLLVDGMTKKETAEELHARAAAKLEGARKDLAATRQELEAPGLKDKQRAKLAKKLEKLEGDLPKLEEAAAKAHAAIPADEDGQRPQGVRLPDGSFAILLKADGGTTYTTRDLTAAFYRAETYAPTKVVYVVGNEQRDHFIPWFQIVEAMGQPWGKGLTHVGFGKYRGMRTRRGTAVFLDEVLERARQKALEAAEAATKKVELSPEETARVARAIGTGAVKLFDLRSERQKDIDLSLKPDPNCVLCHERPPSGVGDYENICTVCQDAGRVPPIDWDRLLDLKGDTGPYLQFAYARLAGILRRFEGEVSPTAARVDLLVEPEAAALVKTVGEFPQKLRQAAEADEPSVIARYVLDLAQKTHRFVHHHRVIDATPSDEQAAAGVTPEVLRATRVFLVACSKKVIAEALDLLGIEALEQM